MCLSLIWRKKNKKNQQYETCRRGVFSCKGWFSFIVDSALPLWGDPLSRRWAAWAAESRGRWSSAGGRCGWWPVSPSQFLRLRTATQRKWKRSFICLHNELNMNSETYELNAGSWEEPIQACNIQRLGTTSLKWSYHISYALRLFRHLHLQLVRCYFLQSVLSILTYVLVKTGLQISTQGKCLTASGKFVHTSYFSLIEATLQLDSWKHQSPELREYLIKLGKIQRDWERYTRKRICCFNDDNKGVHHVWDLALKQRHDVLQQTEDDIISPFHHVTPARGMFHVVLWILLSLAPPTSKPKSRSTSRLMRTWWSSLISSLNLSISTARSSASGTFCSSSFFWRDHKRGCDRASRYTEASTGPYSPPRVCPRTLSGCPWLPPVHFSEPASERWGRGPPPSPSASAPPGLTETAERTASTPGP